MIAFVLIEIVPFARGAFQLSHRHNIPFHCTSLASVTIGVRSFSGCTSLASITIPDSVQTIGQGAFSGCSDLNYILIGAGVTSIGQQAFFLCGDGFAGLYVLCLARVPPTLETTDGLWFNHTLGTFTPHFWVPADSVNAYKAAWPSGYNIHGEEWSYSEGIDY